MLLAQLEHSRLQLAGLVAVTVGGAFVVALAMSWWLSRPIGSIVRSIERLGESRFDNPWRSAARPTCGGSGAGWTGCGSAWANSRPTASGPCDTSRTN
jgi:hypothetical protein